MKEIFSRASVRKFKEIKVEENKVELLLRAAMAAPSAGNQQEWEFVIVTDRELLNKLSTTSPFTSPLKNSQLAIVVLGNKERMKYPENWEQDLGAATQNILLEAVHCGLGGVWLGIAPLEERINKVSQVLNLPTNILPFSIVSIGYPDGDVRPQDRFNQNYIHYNGY